MGFVKFASCVLLPNGAAAHHGIAVVQNHRLPFCNGPLGHVENNLQSVFIRLGHSGPLLRVPGSNFRLKPHGALQLRQGNQVDVPGRESGTV